MLFDGPSGAPPTVGSWNAVSMRYKTFCLPHSGRLQKSRANVASPINPPSTDASSASWERVPASGARAEKAINKQFSPRLNIPIGPTIRMHIDHHEMHSSVRRETCSNWPPPLRSQPGSLLQDKWIPRLRDLNPLIKRKLRML